MRTGGAGRRTIGRRWPERGERVGLRAGCACCPSSRVLSNVPRGHCHPRTLTLDPNPPTNHKTYCRLQAKMAQWKTKQAEDDAATALKEGREGEGRGAGGGGRGGGGGGGGGAVEEPPPSGLKFSGRWAPEPAEPPPPPPSTAQALKSKVMNLIYTCTVTTLVDDPRPHTRSRNALAGLGGG